LYVGLRNPKKHLKTPENAKHHHIYAYPRLAPAVEATAPGARPKPSPGHAVADPEFFFVGARK
jgi:hypothetical protein